MIEDYRKACKRGRREVADAVAHGRYPYLPALDDILGDDRGAGELPVGVREIPMELGLQQDEDLGVNWLEENPDSESAKAFKAIAEHIHSTVKFKHTPYEPSFSSCSPSACASCTANCSSKKS